MHRVFVQTTNGPGLYEITRGLARWLDAEGATEGVLTLHIRHTSASLLIQENADPSVQHDLLGFLDRLAPPADDPRMAWMTHRSEGADDMPAHVKAAFLPSNLSIPVIGGRMVLGTWQGVFVVEHRRQPHRRDIAAFFR